MTLLDSLYAEGYAPRTVKNYARVISDAQAWCAGRGTNLEEVPASLISEFAATRPRTNPSQKVLRSALAAYWRISEREHPPAAAVRVPRRRRMRCRALEPDEAAHLETTAQQLGDHRGLVVLIGLYLGLRREEIAGLRWEHFFDELQWVNVVGKGEIEADLPVHPVLVNALEHARQAEGWVFPGRFAGRPVSTATVWQWVRHVSELAGLEPVSTHRLRHTCLATMNDATGDLRAVQEFARHARPETTAGYTRVTTKRMLQLSMALDYSLRAAS